MRLIPWLKNEIVEVMINQKGVATVLLIVGVLILVLFVVGFYYKSQNSISPKASLDASPNPITLPYDSMSPSSEAKESSPEAKTLDVDFQAGGVTLKPVGNSEVNVWWKLHTQELNEDDYTIKAKEYLVENTDAEAVTKTLISQNWDTNVAVNNYDFSGDAAGGCGFITGYIGHKNGQLRSINVEEYYTCATEDFSETPPDPERRVGVYISVSEIVPISQILNSH